MSDVIPDDHDFPYHEIPGIHNPGNNNNQRGPSQPAMMVEALQNEPDYSHTIRDVAEKTGIRYSVVKRDLARLASSGKLGGPVSRVGRGLYRYDPAKEDRSLMTLARSGNWRIENLLFVSLGGQSGSGTTSKIMMDLPGHDNSNSQCIPVVIPGYPRRLPSGQTITWKKYINGTETIHISAKGAPPLSPDHVLTLLEQLRREGLDPKRWTCKSLEVNIDSHFLRLDASYSIQIIQNLIMKAYQHGYNTRLEIADRRSISPREVMDLFHSLTNSFDGTAIQRRVNTLDERVGILEKHRQRSMTTPRQTGKCSTKPVAKREKNPIPCDDDLPPCCKRLSDIMSELGYFQEVMDHFRGNDRDLGMFGFRRANETIPPRRGREK